MVHQMVDPMVEMKVEKMVEKTAAWMVDRLAALKAGEKAEKMVVQLDHHLVQLLVDWMVAMMVA